MMIALLGVLAGLCIIFGAKGFAERILSDVAGLILVVTFLTGLLARCSGLHLDFAPALQVGVALLAVVTMFFLAAIGFLAWRTRAYSARRREEVRKRSSAPRERALPAAPAAVPTEDA